jgi:hypothetical protein
MATIAATHTVVKSRPATGRFGSGILRFIPLSRGFEPSDDDRRAAAQMFADAGDPDYDTLAGEAAFLASLESLSPPPAGICRSCGEMAESLTYGYCDVCDDAGTEATIKGQNARAGLGYRVH